MQIRKLGDMRVCNAKMQKSGFDKPHNHTSVNAKQRYAASRYGSTAFEVGVCATAGATGCGAGGMICTGAAGAAVEALEGMRNAPPSFCSNIFAAGVGGAGGVAPPHVPVRPAVGRGGPQAGAAPASPKPVR